MKKILTLYHGSEDIVEVPTFGKGKKNNDFGLGFYCTESEALAMEWAVSDLRNGLYMQDIMRGGIGNEDSRIPRNVCEQSARDAG